MLKYLIYFLIILLFSCRGEEKTTRSKFYLINNSGVTVKVAPTIALTDTLVIQKDQTLEYDLGFERGTTPGFSSAFFLDGFPITLIFENAFQIVHFPDTFQHTGKYYPISSNRNLYNRSSYQKTVKDNNKYSRFVTLTYTFTQEDYLFAK